MENHIPEKLQVEPGPQHRYRMTVEDLATGQKLYENESNGGLMCTVEKVTQVGPEIEGQHQLMAWGNPMIQFYASDQLKKWIDEALPEMMREFQKRGYIQSNIDIAELFKKGKKQ